MKLSREKYKIAAFSDDNQLVGLLTYYDRDGVWVADHTLVDSAGRGGGYGSALVNELADYARDEGVKVQPRCPFIARVFEAAPDKFGDVDARN